MRKINGIYVEHMEDKVNLYGAFCREDKTIEVYLDTKNEPGMGIALWGQKFTGDFMREQMFSRKTHNFIGFLGQAVSCPVREDAFLMI